MYFAAAAAGFAASAGLIIAIGAQNAFILRQGIKRQHIGLVVVLCALSDIALIILGIAGIGALVQQYPVALQVFRFGGAAFLAVYGLMAARRALQGTSALTATTGGQQSWKRVALTCLAFTFLNPHVYLDTMVLLGSISTRYQHELRWVFAAGACSASVVWFITLGYGARMMQPVFRNPRAWRVLDGSIAVFMLTLCTMLILNPLG